jgi:hypothetical protein
MCEKTVIPEMPVTGFKFLEIPSSENLRKPEFLHRIYRNSFVKIKR